MSPSEMWADVLRWLIAVSGGGTVFLFLAKALGKQLLSRNIERFKNDIQHESQAKIAELKSELEKKQAEHQERFRWFHGKRGEALELIHHAYVLALIRLENADSTASFAVEFGHGEVYWSTVLKASKANHKFHKALRSLDPFLPPDLLASLESGWKEFSRVEFNLRMLGWFIDRPDATTESKESAATEIHRLVSEARENSTEVIAKFRVAFETEGAQPDVGHLVTESDPGETTGVKTESPAGL